eukprot:TRINITY_DN672_c0_g1_i3.p1 TRINITY_DN672_c0_g1~~TRINITY_DN672_c0_g1_i3.p1  ORF type:complete len:262 (-),score=81.54 TRINITY_DN672_c0_g1_i3:38-823(-)
MGWEVRVFYPLTDESFDLWQHLGLGEDMADLDPEVRTDVYFHIGDKKAGLKIRGANKLELKLMRSATDNHKVEEWDKCIEARVESGMKGSHVSAGEVGIMLQKQKEIAGVKDIIGRLEAFKGMPIPRIKIDKQRKQDDISTGKCIDSSKHGSCHVTAEQTDMTVSLVHSTPDGKEVLVAPLGMFRSVCLERHDHHHSMEALMEVLHEKIGTPCWWMGYPEFVDLLFETTIASKKEDKDKQGALPSSSASPSSTTIASNTPS